MVAGDPVPRVEPLARAADPRLVLRGKSSVLSVRPLADLRPVGDNDDGHAPLAQESVKRPALHNGHCAQVEILPQAVRVPALARHRDGKLVGRILLPALDARQVWHGCDAVAGGQPLGGVSAVRVAPGVAILVEGPLVEEDAALALGKGLHLVGYPSQRLGRVHAVRRAGEAVVDRDANGDWHQLGVVFNSVLGVPELDAGGGQDVARQRKGGGRVVVSVRRDDRRVALQLRQDIAGPPVDVAVAKKDGAARLRAENRVQAKRICTVCCQPARIVVANRHALRGEHRVVPPAGPHYVQARRIQRVRRV